MRRRRTVAMSIGAIALSVGVTTACGPHSTRGSSPGLAAPLSHKQVAQVAQAFALTLSGKPRKVFTFHVNLDSAASAVADAVIRDEYETRNCSSSNTLFVPPVPLGGGVSVVPNQCDDYLGDHFWFVAGTMRVVKHCSNEDALGPGYIVKTNECFRFKVVGKQRGLVGAGLLSYPWELMQMQLIHIHGRWLVASEDQAYLANANGFTLWLHRVN